MVWSRRRDQPGTWGELEDAANAMSEEAGMLWTCGGSRTRETPGAPKNLISSEASGAGVVRCDSIGKWRLTKNMGG